LLCEVAVLDPVSQKGVDPASGSDQRVVRFEQAEQSRDADYDVAARVGDAIASRLHARAETVSSSKERGQGKTE